MPFVTRGADMSDPVTAVIGAIADKLMGDRAADKAYKRQRRDMGNRFRDLRKAAVKGGFNPLTALYAGGAPTPDYQGPALSSASFIGSAVAEAASSWFNDTGDKDAEYQSLRQNEQAKAAAEFGASRDLPGSFGYDLTEQVVGRASSGPPPLPPAKSASDDGSLPPARSIPVMGRHLSPTGYNVDAQTFSDRYGDLAGEAYGLGSLALDTGASVRAYHDERASWRDYYAQQERAQASRGFKPPRLHGWHTGYRKASQDYSRDYMP